MTEAQSRAIPPGWRTDLLAAIGVALVALGVAGIGGFADLLRPTDNDSLLRLVEVRDLIAGQGWFDMMQYRLGPEGGVAMHWSRFVDAPIAALVLLGQTLGLSAPAAENVAATLWPTALLGVSVFLIMRIARLVDGEGTAFPAAVVGGLALMSLAIFLPGMIDHHNVQLMLALLAIWGLIAATAVTSAVAGAAAALSLAVGMETAPYVAIAGAVAALPLLWNEAAAKDRAAGFGGGFALTAGAAFLATVPWASWGVAACDAFSLTHVAVAVPAGLGLVLIGLASPMRPALRVAALGALAASVAAIAVLAFPQCLADPYASLDPTLKRLWLDGVVEAQSVIDIAWHDPAIFAARYVTPALALIVVAGRAFAGRMTARETILAVFLVGAILVSFWQVRGSLFSVPIAAIVLSGWIARCRENAKARPVLAALAWVVSINSVWAAAGGQAERLMQVPAQAARAGTGACLRAEDLAPLATLPPQTVLAVSNLGPAILRYTSHRVLAGPYHRNVEGNLAVMRTLLAPPAEAEAIARANHAGIVAFCPGNPETALLAREAADGLAAALSAGDAPDWLRPLTPAGQALQLYQVDPDGR